MDLEHYRQQLEEMPADRRLVDELHAQGKITSEARKYALNLIFPENQWGFWASRQLLAFGVLLMLSGVIYFYAFNWAKLTPLIKLGSVEFGLVGCLFGAYFYSLDRLAGRAFLVSTTVLVGVFMAVFGQIYQTGADVFQLFMMWSLLTFGWTVISHFLAQWFLWMIITNLFLSLYFSQGLNKSDAQSFFLAFFILSIFNGGALAILEYFTVSKACKWLQARWPRILLAAVTIFFMLIPILRVILDPTEVNAISAFYAMFGLVGHATIFYVYRFRLPEIRCLFIVLLSGSLIAETLAYKIFSELFSMKFMDAPNQLNYLFFLLMAGTTYLIFSKVLTYLRNTSIKMEGVHDQA